jgi:hypothetical protein
MDYFSSLIELFAQLTYQFTLGPGEAGIVRRNRQ